MMIFPDTRVKKERKKPPVTKPPRTTEEGQRYLL